MILKSVILILCVHYAWGLEEGDPCLTRDYEGSCKPLDDCEYAVKLIQIDQKKPALCKWNLNTRVVCCPLEKMEHKIVRDFPRFSRSSKGGRIFNDLDNLF